MFNSKNKIFYTVCILLVAIIGSSHEYILIASSFKLSKGDTLEAHLFVADGFNIELERPIQKSITQNFELISNNQTVDLLQNATDGSFPIIKTKVDFDGLGLIHMERDYAFITLSNEKFKEYLKEDYIENIQIDTKNKTSQRERYSRYIKSLIQSGNANKLDTLHKKIVHQAFEIVLLDNPYLLKVGNQIKAQVFFRGKPLANKKITARNRVGGLAATKQITTTNENGICNFTINRKGDWFIHATHMIACSEPIVADWESFWVSYSFGIE